MADILMAYKGYQINDQNELMAVRPCDSLVIIRKLSERELDSYQEWLPKLNMTSLGTWSCVHNWLDDNVKR